MRTWGRRINRTLVVLAVLGAGAAAAWVSAVHWRPSRASYPLQGPDVSAAQGAVEWPTVRVGGADFAYVRATIGADERDERFAQNWHDLRAAGLRRGAYHAYSLCRPAVDQANNFVTTVPRSADALPAAVAVDFTPDCGAHPARAVVVGEVARFAAMVEAHTGKPVLIRVSREVDQAYRLSAAIPRGLWSVQDFFPPDYAARPWRMWAASDMRRIEGIEGPARWNVVRR